MINIDKYPKSDKVFQIVELLFDSFFTQEKKTNDIKNEILTLFQSKTMFKSYYQILDDFVTELPIIKNELIADATFFYNSDPAADSIEEVIITYPGLFAIFCHRIAHNLYQKNIPVIPRMISEYAHSKTGIDIHPGAQIQSPFFIDHGTGIVIGQTAIIGKNVKIYQGVTLGALAVSKEIANTKRHPTIEDNVVLYAGCCILGGNTIIGENSIVGGNVWLTHSISPNSLVYHKSEIKFRNDTIEFMI